MKTACLAVPPVEDLYPYSATKEGLKYIGYSVGMDIEADILVTWSPWNGSRRQAMQQYFQKAGKPVIVMENGWLSPMFPWFSNGKALPFYQVALDGWNGTGHFPAGDASRWKDYWQMAKTGSWTPRSIESRTGIALVIGQRGHPSDDRTAPPDWHQYVQIPGVPEEYILRRPAGCGTPLIEHLKIAAECHVWSSNAASHAILAGVPVVQHGPNLMVGAVASRPGEPLFRGDATPELERLAWAQWSEGDIRRGEPFVHLLWRP